MTVRVARGLSLPDSIVTRRTAILAKTGAGKSNTAKVIVEGCLALGAQVVILDPVGHWWGLRSLYPIPVLGGMSGDIPLDPLAGKLIARTVVESGASMVLDCSGMDSDGQMQRFAKDFAKTLYDLKQAAPTAMLLVIEEADEFAPQDTRGAGVPEMVGAFARIAKRGRGRGIGLLSVTLRSAALSKNVLNQTDTLVAMRTTAPLDLKAVDGWLQYVEMPGAGDVLGTLPGLETGTAWFITPEDSSLERVKVLKARSLDTSSTPRVGDVAPDLRQKLKPIDLDRLGAAMAETAERARENDPAELRRRVAEAEREVMSLRATAQAPAAPSVRVETVTIEVPVEVPALTEGERQELDGLRSDLAAHRDGAAAACDSLVELLNGVTARINAISRPAPRRQETVPVAPVGLSPGPPARPKPTVPPANPSNGAVSGSQKRVLDAIAWWEAVGVRSPSVGQVAFVVSSHQRSKGFTNNLSALSSGGYIERTPGAVSLTPDGSAHATYPAATPTEDELRGLIYDQVGPGRARILAAIIGHGEAMAVEGLAAIMGYHARSKGFTNNLSSLSGLGLIDRSRGYVKATGLCYLRGGD